MSHNTHPVCGAHGSTRNVVGSAIMRKSPPPSISAMPKPPPGVKTGNAVLCAVSLARSVVVIEQPLRIPAAASLAMTDFPRRMPCWSGNERRTTSSPYSSIHLSALTAASYCSSFHNPWRSTKLCAVLSCDEDTGLTCPAETPEVSRFIFGARALDRQALVVEAQTIQTAQLLARPCAARTAVIALRHDDAVPGMGARDRRVDHEQPSMAWPDCAHHAGEKCLVFAVDRSDQGAAAARDQTGGVLFITIGH